MFIRQQFNPSPPLFSVVVPAYNVAQYIVEALDSVASQTYKDYELIVVDDGSTDGTASIVQEWMAGQSTVKTSHVRQENKGLGGARNSGIRVATGEFVALLDADDYWLREKLERVAELIAVRPDVDVVCHGEWHERPGNKRQRVLYGPYKTYEKLLFKHNCLSPSATCIRRDCLLAVGGMTEDRGLHGVEDYALWLALAKRGAQFEYLSDILGVYRVLGQGMTARVHEHSQNTLNLLECHLEAWRPKTFWFKWRIRIRRSRHYRSMALASTRDGDRNGAWRYYLKALALNPMDMKGWAGLLLLLTRIHY